MSDPTALLPLLPLRDLVVFPHMVVPLIVGRRSSRLAIEAAYAGDKRVMLVSQRDALVAQPGADDLFEIGTVGTILQMVPIPDGNLKVLVEGVERARIVRYLGDPAPIRVEAELLGGHQVQSTDGTEDLALVRTVREAFERYVKLHKNLSPELLLAVARLDDLGRLSDTLVGHLSLKQDARQVLLEQLDPRERLRSVLRTVQEEIEILQVERKIKSRVKRQMERNQKEFYLNEQMEAIQRELGEKDEFKNELEDLARRVAEKALSDEARERLEREVRKLRMMNPMSAEAAVVRNYVDQVLALPWGEVTAEELDIERAAAILDEDHYGLRDVKERVLEHLSVASLVSRMKGPILCLVGPPGVGKTSLGRSIARATGRDFVRQALGGVRDEAEIRGHRRTYIGAMPGKIIQSMKRAGSNNPLFLLDEVDKMSTDFRGDPSAALLEVLDPEQNQTFNDHYLDLDYDLSQVMFLCTANTLEGIPAPLQDRLEIIPIHGYTEQEKLSIAQRYLLPKQIESTGLKPEQITVTRQAVERVIREYTREAGVRNLERELAKVCRKVARRVVFTGPESHTRVNSKNLQRLLGVPRFTRSELEETDQVGVVKGLAVTSWGGEVLAIEVAVVPGSGKLILTGRLGDWLKESATAGFSYIRSRAESLGLDPDFQEHSDFHVHYPGNSLRTDGPSAGIAMATALTSALTGVPVRRDLAMTGEITLRGRVLPIGGLKSKSLAAYRVGARTILVPKGNAKDLADLAPVVREHVEIVLVEHMDEVLEHALRWPEGARSLSLPSSHPAAPSSC